MIPLTRLLVKVAGRRAAQRFDQAARDPAAAQQQKLAEILEHNRDTEYGRQHGFGSIRTLDDYRKAVPVVTYEDIRPLMDRMTRGERNILTAETPVMFARTSGTSGDPKYIPVTPTCRSRDHQDQVRTWLYHSLADHPTIFDGKAVSLVSPAVEGHTPSGIPYGSTSGAMYRDMPRIVRSTYAIPYPIFEIEDYDLKYYCLLRLALAHDVTLLATANPSSILKLCEIVNERAEDLIRDLHDGGMRNGDDLPAAAAKAMEAERRPRPDRARALAGARATRGGRLLPADYWPRLALIACWKGGTVGHYLEAFDEYFNPDGARPIPVRDWGYLSSEARGSVPITDEGEGGVLTVAANVYDFVPVADIEEHEDDWRRWTMLAPHEVKEGESYYILITTTGGLYRYDINDIVRVVGKHHRTPIIAFASKGRGVTNITGEKVSVEQVVEAFTRAAKESGVKVGHFKAEACIKEARYAFKVELEGGGGGGDGELNRLLSSLDKSLGALNLEYASKRKSGRLKPPVLLEMKPGWYDRSKSTALRDTKRVFQAKTILLSERKEEETDKAMIARTISLTPPPSRAEHEPAR